ncbi:MAG: UDP-2,3-diacylglucosamine diphosphatase [Legionellales bacterium]|nr:UDP-2,3-diacylglucosamine diphosphatase [Legionellales bacterium]|tara:strand:+ start:34935 stop:35654 length:720 start_codon:yes stop_codon:yes gene_type:complete
MKTVFISDLHLAREPNSNSEIFLRLLANLDRDTDALYILGDLFEAWLGDDDTSPLYETIIATLKHVHDCGIPVYLMHGNRDFLLGDAFCQQTGCQLLSDPTVINLYGTPTLLMHGDLLCIDDLEYQAYRQQVRGEQFQSKVLQKPLWVRRLIARFLRWRSRWHNRRASLEIMDANQQAVFEAMQQHHVRVMIHGHTHRPAIELRWHGKHRYTRYVLSDWEGYGNKLEVNGEHWQLRNFR